MNMSKIATLQAGLDRVAGRNSASSQPEPKETASVPAPKGTSREGKVHIGAYLPADFKKSLRAVQAQTDEDIQTVLARALNELFKSHNVPVVDPNS